MSRFRFSPSLIIGILIAIFCCLSLIYRVYLPYNAIFVGDWIKFTSNDAYYQMRLVDGIVLNFPHLPRFDPYLIYPGGSGIGSLNFFAWLLAGISWLVGLGSPTQHTIDLIGVYAPPVMAALSVIPVYFIGRALFNRWAGVLAAALMAVLPGEFLGRTILGFTDLPAPEVLFSTVTALFLILAVKSAGEKQLTWASLLKRDWKTAARPLVFSALAGLFLGVYLLTWLGSSLFVFIISLYFILQFIINHLRHKSSDHLGIVGFISFLVAIIVFLPVAPARDISLGMVVAMLIPPALAGISRLLAGRGLKPFYYPLSLICIGVIFIAILYAVAPNIPDAILNKFGLVFYPEGSTAVTTLEMQHFLSPEGRFSTQIAWGNFTTSFFLISPNLSETGLQWFPGFAIITILIAIWLSIRLRSDKKNQVLLFVLLSVMVIASFVLWIVTPLDWKLKFPGFAFISLFILVWLFTRQRSDTKLKLFLRILNLVILAAALILLYFWVAENTTVLLIFAMLAVFLLFIFLIWLASGQRDDDEKMMFLFIWTLVILVATLVQRRFAYYLVVNIAVLSAYLPWKAGWLVGLKRLATNSDETAEDSYRQARNIGIPAGIILLILSVLFSKYMYVFLPIWLIGIASLLYGCWGWAKYKGKSELWSLWGLLIPIGFIVLALAGKKTAKAKVKEVRKESKLTPVYYVNTVLAIITVFSFVCSWNITKSWDVASEAPYAPSDAWQSSLEWMRENTPEPMSSPDAYYKLYQPPPSGEQFAYPESAYGVTTWWDYGYWVTRIAHRLPSTNPSQDPVPIAKVAKLFLSQDEAVSREIMSELGSAYIISEYSLAIGKFWAVINWAGQEESKYTDVYYLPNQGELIPISVLYPDYYRTLLVRLFNFDGKAVADGNPMVFTYEEKVDRSGNRYKQITDFEEFASYQEALDYVAGKGTAKTVIVGRHPFISPIPLEALTDYKLVHSSNYMVPQSDMDAVPEIKIFEYAPQK